jgi:pilus assembly protein FimV
MVAKRSSRALALLLALPSAAFALGLGDIRLLSPLNSPLDAEIDLVDVAPDEASTVQVQLAPRDAFAKNGLDWPAFLSSVQVHTTRLPDGREVVKLKSTDPVSDPFVTILVEVNWSRGRLMREYTMLLDPPVYTPGQSSVASAPVSAPATGAGAREGTIARTADTTPPAPAPETPPPAPAPPVAPAAAVAAAAAGAAATSTAAPGVDATATSEPAPSESAAPASSPPSPPSPPSPSARHANEPRATAAESSEHVVQRGETLSGIAADISGTSGRTRNWMLAIYQANPRAFEQNMNVLRTGAVLRIPDAATVETISTSEAAAEIHRQYAAWRGAAGGGTETPGAQPGRLKLVTPSESASAGAAPGAAPSGEVSALQGRVQELEGQLAESKRLLEMKNAELARMQAQLAAKQNPASAAAPPSAPPEAPPAAVAPPPAPPPVAEATPPPSPPAVSEEKPPAVAAEAPPPPPPVKPAVTKPAPKAPAPSASGGSIFDYWWVALLVLLGIAGLIASRVLRSRRAAQFDDSLGRLAVAGAAAAGGSGGLEDPDLGGGPPTMGRGFGASEPPLRATPPPAPEPTFLVEETGTHERPRVAAGAGAAAAAPAPRHVASDETISSETAINLDQGDPLAEADFHMAYGLYDQAADLIRIAIGREPARRDLKLKLLEVFFVWGNKEQFLQTARELAESRADAAPGEWEKILIMGKQLAPEDPLFSGGAVTGAAAGGVDLDLEGGQSRVDFDLLGEPAGGESAAGVDLDIGAAVGDQAAESPSIVTDRNAALLETTFSSTTGTTRQMTARVRPDASGSTAEVEGPTVEQPALAPQSQPTVRQKVETALRKGGVDQTAELAVDDLGLDIGAVDTVDQPGPAAAASSTPDAPTLVAGLDERSRKQMETASQRALKEDTGVSTGAWQFDQNELEAALTQTSVALQDVSATGRLAALKGHDLDVDVGDATGTHVATPSDVDLDVGAATGSHTANGAGLDLDVGTATVPDAAFAATQKLSSEDLALPDLEPVTMSEVGTKLDLARAYMDMGDPDGARNILEEVLNEGSAAQKQEAQRLMESLPG